METTFRKWGSWGLGFEVRYPRRIGDGGRVNEVCDEGLEELDEGFADGVRNT